MSKAAMSTRVYGTHRFGQSLQCRGGGIGAAGAAMAAPLFSSSKATPCRHTYNHAYLISNEIAISRSRDHVTCDPRGKCLRV